MSTQKRIPNAAVTAVISWPVVTVFVLAVVILAPIAAGASDLVPKLDPEGISFPYASESNGWVLTVSGPNGYHQRREFRGVPPSLSLVTAGSAPPADGTYIWELRVLGSLENSSSTRSSGAFQIEQGRPVPRAAATEERPSTGGIDAPDPTPFPPTHSGNVTIAGRLCVGDDCADAETFPFEAIKMKQNNAWIETDDTSGAMFPARNWRLQFNDAGNFVAGATNHFAVVDRGDTSLIAVSILQLDAGAPPDSIRVDQNGNVGLGTATPSATLQVAGDAVVDGDFTAGSSRDIKHRFETVDPREVLDRLMALPITEWSYRDGDSKARHIGPVSEDFHAAFGLGRDDRHVSPIDLSGVAFAAIQGLHRELDERRAEIADLKESRDRLLRRLEALEARLESGAAEAAPGR